MKRGFVKDKKGITTQYLVGIILITTGFLAVVVLWSGLLPNLNKGVDKELCHFSVQQRGLLPDVVGTGLKEILPLNCRTEKVCVTSNGKGDCKESFGKKYLEKELAEHDVYRKRAEIKKILADEMLSCWRMMGEGEAQVFKREMSPNAHTKCVICSRIDFDDEAKKLDKISGFGEYLVTTKMKGEEDTYWEAFTSKAGEVEEGVFGKDVLSISEKAILYIEVDGSGLTDILTPNTKLAMWGIDKLFKEGRTDENYLSIVLFSDYSAEQLSKIGCYSFENLP